MDQCAPWFPVVAFLVVVVGMIYIQQLNSFLASKGMPQSIAGVIYMHQILSLLDLGLTVMFVLMAISNSGSCGKAAQIAWLVTGGLASVRLLRRFININTLIY